MPGTRHRGRWLRGSSKINVDAAYPDVCRAIKLPAGLNREISFENNFGPRTSAGRWRSKGKKFRREVSERNVRKKRDREGCCVGPGNRGISSCRVGRADLK